MIGRLGDFRAHAAPADRAPGTVLTTAVVDPAAGAMVVLLGVLAHLDGGAAGVLRLLAMGGAGILLCPSLPLPASPAAPRSP